MNDKSHFWVKSDKLMEVVAVSAEPTEHVDPAMDGATESRLLLCEHFPAGMTLAAAAVGGAAAAAEEVQGASTLLSLPLLAAAVSGVLKEGVGSSHIADDPGSADEEAAPAGAAVHCPPAESICTC